MDLRDERNNVPAGPSDTVFIDQNTPTTGGVVFDPNTPALTDTLYVSTTNGSTWIYNGSAYTTYTAPAVQATPFYIAGTTIDAGSNKKAIIERSGEVRVKNSTIAKIKTISGTRSLLLSSYVSSRNEILSTGDQLWLGTSDNNPFYLRTNGVERLRVLGTGAIRFNQAYSFPTTDGAAGQALKTDGAGVISFGDVSMPSGIIYITNQTTGAITYYTTLELARDGAVSGDTIYVNTGTYVVTTTDANGIAKSGVNWYFELGAIVNKATIGHLFNDTGFANGITIDGSGVFNLTSLAYSFCYLTKTSSKINLYNVTSTTSYPIFDLSLLEGAGSTTIGGVGSVNINLNNATSTGGVVVILNGSAAASQINIYFNMLKSTASYVLNGGNQTKLLLSGNLIYSTATYAIAGIANYSVVVANVREINGVTYGWYLSGLGGSAYIESTSKTNGIYFNGAGSYFIQNAHCDTYYVVDGWVKGQSFINLTQTSGYFNGAYIGSNGAPSWSISGGVSEIDCRNNTVGSSRLSFNITGGKVFINGYYQEDYHTRVRVINGANAEVTFNNAQFICTGTAASEVYGGMIILTNGKLRLNNTKFQQGLTTYLEPLIKWTAGTVICNGFVATATNLSTNIFQATTAGLNLKVLSAGLSTSLLNNGGTIAAKKMKYKMTVSSVASTSITLNDGSGGNETFAESDTGVYSTTALLAQRMASLINVSATLDITASQDNPGTDVYFYIEMDTAGLEFTIPTVVNLTSLQVCMNSYLITNITGGTILENSNVE